MVSNISLSFCARSPKSFPFTRFRGCVESRVVRKICVMEMSAPLPLCSVVCVPDVYCVVDVLIQHDFTEAELPIHRCELLYLVLGETPCFASQMPIHCVVVSVHNFSFVAKTNAFNQFRQMWIARSRALDFLCSVKTIGNCCPAKLIKRPTI